MQNTWRKAADGLAYFAVSALLVMRVLMRSSCPYRAAMCSGVFPFLSSQSISAPLAIKTTKKNRSQQLVHKNKGQQERAMKTTKQIQTVFNDLLRSTKPSMDSRHVERSLPIFTLEHNKNIQKSER